MVHFTLRLQASQVGLCGPCAAQVSWQHEKLFKEELFLNLTAISSQMWDQATGYSSVAMAVQKSGRNAAQLASSVVLTQSVLVNSAISALKYSSVDSLLWRLMLFHIKAVCLQSSESYLRTVSERAVSVPIWAASSQLWQVQSAEASARRQLRYTRFFISTILQIGLRCFIYCTWYFIAVYYVSTELLICIIRVAFII